VRQSTVAAQVGGNVLQLAVKAGDRVQAGQLLVRIDDRDAQASALRSNAGVAQADAEWRQARINAERTRTLQGQGFVSSAAVDQAETQLKAAQAGLQQAQAGRTQAMLAREFTAVTAPFAGVVLATHVDAGDLATPGRPLVTLFVPGRLRAVVHVPATRSTLARSAQTIKIQLPSGAWVEPAARTELPQADAVSQTVEWRLDLPTVGNLPSGPGQAVRVRFAAAPAAAAAMQMVLPSSAILRRGELTAVYVAQPSGSFLLKAVRLGADRGAAGVEIAAGLKPGERVALDAVRAGLAGASAQ
jgi:RND family efflux transporter MFP subunit